jgi:hypothetical protein
MQNEVKLSHAWFTLFWNTAYSEAYRQIKESFLTISSSRFH